MKRHLLLLVAAVGGLTRCLSAPEPLSNLTLVWQDEFDGIAGQLPDPANWQFDLGTDWGNGELECYTDRAANAALDGVGHLVITARPESFTGPARGNAAQPCQATSYTSARLTTQGLHEQTEGRFEARIQLPISHGVWPAFWMLGANVGTVGWPTAGEIDILENFGREPSSVHGSLHGPGYSGVNAFTRRFDLVGQRFDAGFHTFAVEWSSDRINWFVDSTLYQSIKSSYAPGSWVFDHPFYLILNLAVGGGPPGPPDGSTTFPQTMVVDWVRVYRAK
jgi:beta-glucanase (GH16 family)